MRAYEDDVRTCAHVYIYVTVMDRLCSTATITIFIAEMLIAISMVAFAAAVVLMALIANNNSLHIEIHIERHCCSNAEPGIDRRLFFNAEVWMLLSPRRPVEEQGNPNPSEMVI